MKPPLILIHLCVLIGFALLSAYASPVAAGHHREMAQAPCPACVASHDPQLQY